MAEGKMVIKAAEFIKSAVKPADYPAEHLPEIAFAGRSNVGKSSLINVLVNRKRLVRTSSTPGRTQLLNFFDINGAFTFVDLPGFGYAKVPASVQRSWGQMVETYLETRKTLKAVVLIVDIRRTPREEEQDLLAWLGLHRIPSILILTKIDKLSRTKQMRQHHLNAKALAVEDDAFVLFSARTRKGRDSVWARIRELMEGNT
jgi:GTP-binding protein